MEAGTCAFAKAASVLVRRQDPNDQPKGGLEKIIKLISEDFSPKFETDAFLASLGTSLGISAVLFIVWILLRPYHSRVYAPKLRYALSNGRTPPPKVGKGFFDWLKPVMKCREDDLVDKIGMDAIIFLRFLRFCRTTFMILAVLGCCIVIPVNVTCNRKANWEKSRHWEWYALIGPEYVRDQCVYGHIVMAYAFTLIILYLLWKNYKEITELRKRYFDSPEYMNSLHARSLMVGHDFPSSHT
jgi:hypothetical protein